MATRTANANVHIDTDAAIEPGELIARGKKRMVDNILAAGRSAMYYWSAIDSEGRDVEMDKARLEYASNQQARLYRLDLGCYRVVMPDKSFYEFTTPEADLGRSAKPINPPTYSELAEMVLALMQGQTRQSLKTNLDMADMRADQFLDVVSRLLKFRENSETKPFWHGERVSAARVLEQLAANLHARLPVEKEECYGNQLSDRQAGDPALHSYQAVFSHEGRLWQVRVQHAKELEQK